jgi:hypothetical protein
MSDTNLSICNYYMYYEYKKERANIKDLIPAEQQPKMVEKVEDKPVYLFEVSLEREV